MANNSDQLIGVSLMRFGERASNDPDAGLKKEDKGERYLKDLVRMEFDQYPFDKVFYAPSRICQETARALAKYSKECVGVTCDRLIEERPEIHFQSEGLDTWRPFLQNLGEMRTLADLAQAEEKMIKGGFVPEGFLDREGRRIFEFLERSIADFNDTSMLLSIMHSPLPESVALWLWRAKIHLFFRDAKKLEEIPALDFADHYLIVFKGKKFDRLIYKGLQEKLVSWRDNETFKMRLRGGTGGLR